MGYHSVVKLPKQEKKRLSQVKIKASDTERKWRSAQHIAAYGKY